MTRETLPVGEDDLLAYVDGALSAERRALVAEWLSRNPEAAARVAADMRIAETLREGLAPAAAGPLPPRFRVAEIGAGMRRRRAAALRRLAAAFALLVAGGAGGWALHGALGRDAAEARLVTAAVTAHRIYVVEKLHPVEVGAEAREHLGIWLGNRIGKPAPVPDLSAIGLNLLGGRLLPGPEGPAGQIMYETADGARVTLYLEAGTGAESEFRFTEIEGVEALAWRSPDLAYVLAGPVGRDRLVKIAHQVHAPPDA